MKKTHDTSLRLMALVKVWGVKAIILSLGYKAAKGHDDKISDNMVKTAHIECQGNVKHKIDWRN